MALGYWQAKIWGLLHDPVFKALHSNSGRGDNSFWRDLEVMKLWGKHNPEESTKKILKQIKLADYITSASDRSAIGSLTQFVNYDRETGLELRHLLSGEPLDLKLADTTHKKIASNRTDYLKEQENQLFNQIPARLRTGISENEAKELFWWLWRCLPQAATKLLDDENLLLMPAETRIPDGSIWSHASLTAAIAGALAGYDLTSEDVVNKWPTGKQLSHAYLVSFTFSPVQELIKASRKMRDFWAGSWILHYLSAQVCWQLAQQYGPDSLIYPSLYAQPLIDQWLLEKYPDFKPWIDPPSDRQLLTAGFPNIIILVLPKDKVAAAMQTAKSSLLKEWKEISRQVFEELGERHWMPKLKENSRTWDSWLNAQWQTYYVGVPIGREDQPLTSSEIYQENENSAENQAEDPEKAQSWRDKQNELYNLYDKKALFLEKEQEFLQKAGKLRLEKWKKHPFSSNVGSWWSSAFDQNRSALAAVKNARDWQIPTAFGPRSTISGLGPVVHPDSNKDWIEAKTSVAVVIAKPVVHPDSNNDWISEKASKEYWQRNAGLFDGIEQLNATETVKRGLHLILPKLLKNSDQERLDAAYPDLTVGVAGYLKTGGDLDHFHHACRTISRRLREDGEKIPPALTQPWGIPYIDDHIEPEYKRYHPRFLNAGWLVEELEITDEEMANYRHQLSQLIDQNYPHNNPADWYVIAAGDGDGMGEWLKGQEMKPYREYIPKSLHQYADHPPTETDTLEKEVQKAFGDFVTLNKRMGPSTHSALSRALLDFSNQLVPYLTEQRYAGRLIYGGGDDVLAYTNLWEWDKWLWDIQQCFKGEKDPHGEFKNAGDYWQWEGEKPAENLSKRPLFTMGKRATISFGIVIAHHSVPLAIALENLWEAEKKAKEHAYKDFDGKKVKKDAVQVRVLYGNGNILKSTAKFDVFYQWQKLLEFDLDASIFEQAATIWEQHPAPVQEAIFPWTKAFCSRRENLTTENREAFQKDLSNFLKHLWLTTENDPNDLNEAVRSWMKLAAFMTRKREIKIGGSI